MPDAPCVFQLRFWHTPWPRLGGAGAERERNPTSSSSVSSATCWRRNEMVSASVCAAALFSSAACRADSDACIVAMLCRGVQCRESWSELVMTLSRRACEHKGSTSVCVLAIFAMSAASESIFAISVALCACFAVPPNMLTEAATAEAQKVPYRQSVTDSRLVW